MAGQDFALFTHPRMHVTVSLNREALGPDAFVSTLTSNFTKMRPTDYAGLVRDHICSIVITVGDGPTCKTDQKREIKQPREMEVDREQVDILLKIKVLHRAVLSMMSLAPPSVVHWRQSSNLFTAAEMKQTAPLDIPISLMTHPSPFSSGVDENGTRKIGFRSEMSQLFCPKVMVFAESTIDFPTKLSIMDFLIVEHLHGKFDLHDGFTMKFDDQTQIRIAHELIPDPSFPDGRIVVHLESVGSVPKPPRSDRTDKSAAPKVQLEPAMTRPTRRLAAVESAARKLAPWQMAVPIVGYLFNPLLAVVVVGIWLARTQGWLHGSTATNGALVFLLFVLLTGGLRALGSGETLIASL